MKIRDYKGDIVDEPFKKEIFNGIFEYETFLRTNGGSFGYYYPGVAVIAKPVRNGNSIDSLLIKYFASSPEFNRMLFDFYNKNNLSNFDYGTLVCPDFTNYPWR